MGQMSHEELRQLMAKGSTPAEPKKPRRHEEEDLQRELVAALPSILRPGVIPFHVPNERGNRIRSMILIGLGVRPGVADLVFFDGGRVWFLELKAGKGGLSREQRDFRDDCKANGTPYAVARTIGEAAGHLIGWGLCRQGAKLGGSTDG